MSARHGTAPSRPGHRDSSSRTRTRLVAASALAGLVAVGGVAHLTQDGTSGERVGMRGSLPPAEFPDPGIEHVHGLGVDPADGALYAATHFGLFRLPGDASQPTRVANRYQDTMGFTVVGANTFLGSGHPDFREDHPPRLGLIESTDAGESWRPLSLRGEADFHALHAAHGSVYGYDAGSGRFMVTRDRSQWETRSHLAMRDFAVSPTDPDAVLATTERGLALSTDGGRTWEAVDAPPLAVLAWETADALYGVAPDGAVHHSPDGGATWAARGSAGGPPEAVTAHTGEHGEHLYVAVSGGGILQSTDGGRTFGTRYAE